MVTNMYELDTIRSMDLTNIYTILHTIVAKYVCF